jgi:hypothetical protein
MKIFVQTLPQKTKKLVEFLQREKPDFLQNFYLSGGTSLSLQLGHRESEDLDFFIQEEFDPSRLQVELEQLGQLEDLELAKGTLNTYLDRVKLQFLHYPYPLLKKATDWQGISLSSIIDIACTKLQTIGARGSKKDFVDLFFILQQYSLTELFDKLSEKYPLADFSQTHILKSLVYFEDANDQPMPRMHKEIKWEEIKLKLSQEVKNLSL